MADRITSDHEKHPPALEARLNAFGAAERARLIEPSPGFLSAVRAAQPAAQHTQFVFPVRRIAALLAVAAAITLLAFFAFNAPPAPIAPGTGDSIVVHPPVSDRDTHTPARMITAGLGRSTSAADIFELLDSMPRPQMPREEPARIGDAYCAGCMDELLRI